MVAGRKINRPAARDPELFFVPPALTSRGAGVERYFGWHGTERSAPGWRSPESFWLVGVSQLASDWPHH
jgi:hypothetical protein